MQLRNRNMQLNNEVRDKEELFDLFLDMDRWQGIEDVAHEGRMQARKKIRMLLNRSKMSKGKQAK